MENILILGAGLMQKPAILAARSLGFKSVVIDADPYAVSVPLADEFHRIDLKAVDEILELARGLQARGGLRAVFTAGTDFSASVSYVCERLGLNAHSYNAALNASIKTRMRECFEAGRVPSPKFLRVTSSELSDSLCLEISKKIAFPLVVKPVDNMGARGCRMVRSHLEFMPALKDALSCSRSAAAIVEEYMEGDEFSIDALVHNGTFTVTGFAIRHIKYPPYFIEVGHTMPAVLDKAVHDELVSAFALGAAALGLTEGAAKADIKYTGNGPMIGEIAGRLSGGYMSGWTYPYASDFKLTEQALKIACTLEPDELIARRVPVDFAPPQSNPAAERPYELFEVPCVRTSAERAWISIPGVVQGIEDIYDSLPTSARDVLPRATVREGGAVDFPRNNVQKCGNVISVCNSCDNAVDGAETAVSNIFITLAPDNPATDAFLAGKAAEDEADFPPSAFSVPQEALEQLCGIIKADEPVEKNIPQILKAAEYKDEKDWNYNTIELTARKFDVLRPRHRALDARGFWMAVVRGGIQGGVYFCDSKK